MPGTKLGGMKARDKNLARDPEFYVKLGKKGGAVEHPETRAFNRNRKLASEAGRAGGLVAGENYKTRSKNGQ